MERRRLLLLRDDGVLLRIRLPLYRGRRVRFIVRLPRDGNLLHVHKNAEDCRPLRVPLGRPGEHLGCPGEVNFSRKYRIL